MKEFLLDDEAMADVSGGYNVDDLSPEDLATLQRLGGRLVEMQIMKKNNDPAFDRDAYMTLVKELSDLDRSFKEKYGY